MSGSCDAEGSRRSSTKACCAAIVGSVESESSRCASRAALVVSPISSRACASLSRGRHCAGQSSSASAASCAASAGCSIRKRAAARLE